MFSLPQFCIERSESVNLYLDNAAKNCKIHSTCSQSMVVHYLAENPTEDNEWNDLSIPETYETHIKGDILVTHPVEGTE